MHREHINANVYFVRKHGNWSSKISKRHYKFITNEVYLWWLKGEYWIKCNNISQLMYGYTTK